MKYSKSGIVAPMIFLATTFLLILYLASIRWHVYLPVTLFWIAVTLMLSTIVFQCLKIELSPSYAKIILLEIVVTCVVFHLIYQIPQYGLRGSDAYDDMNSAKGILSSGFVMGDPQYINLTSLFPMIHVFGVIVSLITGIDLFSVVKWVPSFLGVALILPLYLLVRSIFKEEKIALLSVLLFACLQIQILFSSLFIRETIALILATCCIYLYFSAKHSPHPATNYALSIVFLIGTVLAHHLTSFMLLIFLLTHFLVSKTSEVPSLRKAFFVDNIKGEKITAAFLLIAFSAIFAYWSFVVTFPLYTLTRFVVELLSPGKWGVGTYAEVMSISGASILTIRGYIIFYGFYFFHLIFGLTLLYRLLGRAKNHRLEAYSFTLFLFVCGLGGFLSLYLISPAAFPDRFLMFGWLFGFAPLVVAILKGKSRWLRKIGVFLLIAFMLFNIFMIDPIHWNARSGEISADPSREDYALANAFNFSNGKILAPESSLMAIYDIHNNLGTFLTLSELNQTQTKFDWIIVQKQSATEILTMLEGSSTCDKIYESNSLVVFKQR
jgi:hypothetical protein